MFGLDAISESALMDDRAYALYLQLYPQTVSPTPDYTSLITSEHVDKPNSWMLGTGLLTAYTSKLCQFIKTQWGGI